MNITTLVAAIFSSRGPTAFGRSFKACHLLSIVTYVLISRPRLVQLEDQRNGRAERLFPYVCVSKSAGEGKGSCRRLLSRSCMGYKSVSSRLSSSVPFTYNMHAVEHLSSKNPSQFVRHLKLSCILVSHPALSVCGHANNLGQTTQNGSTATEISHSSTINGTVLSGGSSRTPVSLQSCLVC